jgi:hypothetical protein
MLAGTVGRGGGQGGLWVTGVITKVTSGGVSTAKYSYVRFTTKYLRKTVRIDS